MRDLRKLPPIGLALVLTLAAGGCSVRGPIGDKAGGPPGAPVVLRMALVISGPLRGANRVFVDEVDSLSRGNVRIEPIFEWGWFTPSAEQQVMQAVSSGAVDVGIIGTGVFDTLGNTSFQALNAPMLVDSYRLQAAILQSSIPEQMLAGLAVNGVKGLGILAGSLSKPVAVDAPLLGEDDWRGITFATYLSHGQIDAVRALGATTKVAFGSLRWRLLALGQVQGYAFGLLPYKLNSPQTAMLSPYITANVNLWPGMLLIVANPDRLTTLTPQQLDWLEQAAQLASSRSTALIESETRFTTFACNEGARFAVAHDDDLAWLRRAFAPVYSRLEQDPQTKSFIARIQELKRPIAPEAPLDIPKDCLVGGSGSR
jgi:TRAP-type C4-dicarboxylate transport system substrate-binding protein